MRNGKGLPPPTACAQPSPSGPLPLTSCSHLPPPTSRGAGQGTGTRCNTLGLPIFATTAPRMGSCKTWGSPVLLAGLCVSPGHGCPCSICTRRTPALSYSSIPCTPCILQAHPALHQHPVMEPGCCAPWHTSKEEVRAAGQSRGPQKLLAMVMKRGSEGSSTSCPLELSALSQHPEGGWINVRAFPRLFQPALGIGGTSRPTWDKGHHFMVFLTGWGQQLTEPPQSSVNTLLLHQIAQKRARSHSERDGASLTLPISQTHAQKPRPCRGAGTWTVMFVRALARRAASRPCPPPCAGSSPAGGDLEITTATA